MQLDRDAGQRPLRGQLERCHAAGEPAPAVRCHAPQPVALDPVLDIAEPPPHHDSTAMGWASFNHQQEVVDYLKGLTSR